MEKNARKPKIGKAIHARGFLFLIPRHNKKIHIREKTYA
tara:strand:- start:64 stop:180 length:117 start_codon:yes stop_codon:yes gene_type:complete